MKRWRVVGINFDHMHMGDLLRQALAHPRIDVVGVSDLHKDRVLPVMDRLKLSPDLFVDDYRQLLETTKPDLAILCPATAEHALWTERVAPYNVHILMEKPFAATLAEADRMIAALRKTGRQLAINWPLRWYPSHATAHRLVREGAIGPVIEVHYYDGNRGPVRHKMDKIEVEEPAAIEEKAKSWWYQKDKGGGSLLDYLGYGTTLGTWYFDGKAPIDVTAMVDQPAGLEVDEHSVTVARYDTGLSKYETRWGTFTDPWTNQPQPKCGFVIVGRGGTIASYDYEQTIRVQTRQRPEGYEVPVDTLKAPEDGPMNYLIDCLENNKPIEGPLSPAIARVGQQIVEAAVRSSTEKRTVPLPR